MTGAESTPLARGPQWETTLWGMVGAGCLVGSLVASALLAEGTAPRRVASVLLTLYNVALHTGTGTGAVYVAARVLRRTPGNMEKVVARMFAAVAALTLMMNLRITLIFNPALMVEEMVLGVGAYLLIVAASFRLWQRESLLVIAGLHGLLWVIVQLGMLLAAVSRGG